MEEEKEGRRRRLQRSEEASELSGPFRGFAWRDAKRERHRPPLRNFVFVSRRDFTTTMLHYHPRRVRTGSPSVFRPMSVLSLFLSRAFSYGYTRERRLWGREIPTSLRRCCCATVRPFHRNRSKLARCPSVCLIEIRTVTVAGDERSLQPMLVKIASTDCWAF